MREAPHVVLEWTLVLEELNVGTIDLEATLATLVDEVITIKRRETPLLGDDLELPSVLDEGKRE
jgi:hypothetical protein